MHLEHDTRRQISFLQRTVKTEHYLKFSNIVINEILGYNINLLT